MRHGGGGREDFSDPSYQKYSPQSRTAIVENTPKSNSKKKTKGRGRGVFAREIVGLEPEYDVFKKKAQIERDSHQVWSQKLANRDLQ